MTDVLKFYKKQIEKLKNGKTIIVKCLRCGSKLYINKAKDNGKLFIACATGDCKYLEK